MLPSTTERVPLHSTATANESIRQQTRESIEYFSKQGRHAIERRLDELDHEWDIERCLEANAATASLIGLTMGATVDKRWFLLPTAVAVFLLQHALQGWCPPLELFRRMGVRTATEIEQERRALQQALRDRW